SSSQSSSPSSHSHTPDGRGGELLPPPEELFPEESEELPGPLSEELGGWAGVCVAGGADEASGSIAPTSLSVPRTGCSVTEGRATASPLGSAPARPASEGAGSPTAMPGRAWGISSADGSSATPSATSATATRIPTIRRVFMTVILSGGDEMRVNAS